jgi:probable phosphoglycerate mutase
MTIVLVRHGETTGNFARVVQPPDTPLNEVGIDQAERVARRLAMLEPAHILSSDLLRARMTAEPLLKRTGMQAELEPLLQERNFGDLRGKSYDEFPEGHPFALDLQPPHGESWPVFHERVNRAFGAVVARRRSIDGTLIVITHGLVLHSLADRLISRGELVVPARFNNTSITVIGAQAPHVASLINCTSHLEEKREVAEA